MPSLGTIIHKTPLLPSDLPSHSSLQDASPEATGSRPPLADFIKSTLHEANAFISTIAWSESSPKTAAPSTAKVVIGKSDVSLSEADFASSIVPSRVSHPPMGKEFWYGRRSLHENSAQKGTATFEELDASLRQDHAPKEAEYTPDIFDCVTVVDYATSPEASGLAETLAAEGITVPDMKVYEMAHNLGAMLAPRVFGAAVVSGRMEGDKKFVVVQLPIDLSGYDGAMYSNGRNTTESSTGEHAAVKKKRCVQGYYASIERGVFREDKTEWEMITSSDAGGNLPEWLQNKVAPGKVVGDVGLVIDWIEKNRKKEGTI